jgi:hypothetical protein
MSSCYIRFVPPKPDKVEITSFYSPSPALSWAIVFAEVSATSRSTGRSPRPWVPGEFAMAYLGSGRASPAPPSLAEVDVIGPLAVAGVPQLSATLADRHLSTTRPASMAVVRPRVGNTFRQSALD